MNKVKKVIKKILITFVILLIMILGISAAWYYKNIYKYNQIAEYKNDRNQEIYILGTYHSQHFNKIMNYSMEDIASCIKNVYPDVVFIEAREKTFVESNVIDGPIDMILSYSYCVENGIDVEMIDHWEINNDTRPNTTDDSRDDKIYGNISEKLSKYDEGCRVLIVCGDTHFHEQGKRFKNAGLKRVKIENKDMIFDSEGEFRYPEIMADVIDDKIAYINSDLKDFINTNVTDTESRQMWLDTTESLTQILKKQAETVRNGQLYY